MNDLILALQILVKYANDDYNPTHCEHDVLYICSGITKDKVSLEDIEKLDKLGIFWSNSEDSFISFRFGSC